MKNTIKALIKKESKEGLFLENVPMPVADDRDVLIKVKKTGICGTDLHIFNWDAWAQKNIPVPPPIKIADMIQADSCFTNMVITPAKTKSMPKCLFFIIYPILTYISVIQ